MVFDTLLTLNFNIYSYEKIFYLVGVNVYCADNIRPDAVAC